MLGSVAIRTACTWYTMNATHTVSKIFAAVLLFGGLSLVTAGSPVAKQPSCGAKSWARRTTGCSHVGNHVGGPT
jgi:hypothetical protein